MKTTNYNDIDKGMSLSPDYSFQNQEGVKERLEALLKAFTTHSTKIVILHGCVANEEQGEFSMTAGAAYYNGEIYTVQALPLTITDGLTSGQDFPVFKMEDVYSKQAIYGDHQFRDTFFSRTLKIEMGASGSGITDFYRTELLVDKFN